MFKIKTKLIVPSTGQLLEYSNIADGNIKRNTHFENGVTVPYTVKHAYTYYIPLLEIFLGEMKTYVYTTTSMQMFIAALFIITKI